MNTSFEPRRFRTTVPFYARYRQAYPESLLSIVAERTGLAPGECVLDLGCGPGLLAIPFAKMGARVVAVDPEPDMIAATERGAREAGVAVDAQLGSSFALPPNIAPLKLCVMGRSFHWMDRDATLQTLDGLLSADGAVVLFGDHGIKTHENDWREASRAFIREYGDRGGQDDMVSPGKRAAEAVLLDSVFCDLERVSVVVRQELTADDVVGRAFSLSITSREWLGDRAEKFEAELRALLRGFSPEGRFTETVEIFALMARRRAVR